MGSMKSTGRDSYQEFKVLRFITTGYYREIIKHLTIVQQINYFLVAWDITQKNY